MKDVLEWIIKNKEWIFSGAGLAIISFIFSKEGTRNYIKALFNYKSTITQISSEHKENEKK